MGYSRFLIKRANLASILPQVATPALGVLGGRILGSKYLGAEHGKDIGSALGAIIGGTAGNIIGERMEAPKLSEPYTGSYVPVGAPYAIDSSSQDVPGWAISGMSAPDMPAYGPPAVQKMASHGMRIDPTTGDIPPWALALADAIRPDMKQASESLWEVPISEVPGAPVAQSWMEHGPAAAGRTFLGMSLLGGGGAIAGLGLGKGIEYLAGRPINLPGGFSLTDVVSGLGGTLGALKGMRYAKP